MEADSAVKESEANGLAWVCKAGEGAKLFGVELSRKANDRHRSFYHKDTVRVVSLVAAVVSMMSNDAEVVRHNDSLHDDELVARNRLDGPTHNADRDHDSHIHLCTPLALVFAVDDE